MCNPNKTIFKLHDGTVNLTAGGYSATMRLSSIFSLSVPYLQSSLGFAFRENEVDSPFTRITAPFQMQIWFIICVTLVATVVMILLTKKLSRQWRHFYIGGRVNRTPILNMWITVLGGPVCNPRMTNRRSFGTFARTIMMLWILLWFVIRSSYQGSLYDFLQRHRFSSSYDTIEKINKANCKILIPLHTPRILQANNSDR